MEREHTCCFTRHRRLSREEKEGLMGKLEHEIDNLIGHGIMRFISGGAMGFDMMAASAVIERKKMGKGIRSFAGEGR